MKDTESQLEKSRTKIPAVNKPKYAPHWMHTVLLLFPLVVALATGLLYGQDFIDDAYITFRYAENLAAGNSLTFNPGEAVLGTSSPLFVLALGALRAVSVDVLFSARVLGIIGFIGIIIIIQFICIPYLGRIASAIVALCIALHPHIIFSANSGMETTISMAAVYAAILLSFRGHDFWAGIAGGGAFLLRPDGGIVIILAAMFAFWRRPKKCWQPLLGAGLIVIPWIIFAYTTYGYFLPHSIQAKQLIHADTPLHVLFMSLMHLTLGWGMKAAIFFALIGVVLVMLRKSDLMLLVLWMAVYLAGLSVSRIAPIFPWYITPMLPAMLAMAGYGANELPNLLVIRKKKSRRRFLRSAGLTGSILAIIAMMLMFDSPEWKTVKEMFFGRRVFDYLAIGEELRSRCRPADKVLVGEVGALGYQLFEQVIVDSSGINSPAAYRARWGDRERLRAAGITPKTMEGSPAWVLELIGRFQPRYIVTFKRWLHIPYIMHVPSIERAYRRIDLGMPGMQDYVVLERVTESD